MAIQMLCGLEHVLCIPFSTDGTFPDVPDGSWVDVAFMFSRIFQPSSPQCILNELWTREVFLDGAHIQLFIIWQSFNLRLWMDVNSGHTDFWRFLQRFESIVSVCKAVPPEGLKITGMNIEFQLFPVILHCGKLFCKRRHVFFFLFFLQIGERMQIFTREKLCLSKLLFHTQSCYWTVASWPNKMQNVPPVVLKRFFL